MSRDDLIRQAVFDFNQFISGLSSSRAVNFDVGKGGPPPTVRFKQATREEAVNLFLRMRDDLLPCRQVILDSAKRQKYIFDNDKWARCASASAEKSPNV